MPLSWAVRDALGQLNVLVARKGQLEINEANIRPIQRNSDLTTLAPPTVGQPAGLTDADLKCALKSLQSFLLTITTHHDLPDVCSHIMTLSKQYQDIDHNKIDGLQEALASGKAGSKTIAPSTTDKKETIDDKKDNSVTFLLLDTLCQILQVVMTQDTSSRTSIFSVDERITTTTSTLFRLGGSGANAASSPTTAAGAQPTGSSATSNEEMIKSLSLCQGVIPFAFNYLQHIYSSAVRHAAARLLGLLSTYFLQATTLLFTEKLAACKKNKDMQREFATYQRAIGFLDFRVNTQTNVRVTLDYLTTLSTEMKTIERGVLRQEICLSLESVYSKILSSDSPPGAPNTGRRDQEWQHFMRSEKGVEDWNAIFSNIYTLVSKWSSKSKHTIFCYELLATMLVLSRNITFYQNKKRFDILSELIKLVKKESGETRRDGIRILSRNYLANLPDLFIMNSLESSNEFQLALKNLFPAILPKKTKPSPDDIPYLLECLIQCGKKNLAFFINEICIEVLKPGSSYYSRQKALLLQALGRILEDDQARVKMQSHYIQMGPLVCSYIDESAMNPAMYSVAAGGDAAASSSKADGDALEDKQILLLRAALKCFPHIRHPKNEHVTITASSIVLLCKHEDREISGSVSRVLQDFILLDLNTFFIPTIHSLIDVMKLDINLDTRPDQILKICNTISLLCNTLAEHLQAQNRFEGMTQEERQDQMLFGSNSSNGAKGSPTAGTPSMAGLAHFQVTPAAWITLREHLESVVLMKLCHYEGWVRAELLRMLQNFSRPCFRRMEGAAAAGAASSALSPNNNATSPKSPRELTDIPYLIDYLLPESCNVAAGSQFASEYNGIILPTSEIFYKPLHDLLIHHYHNFHGIISYAFSFLSKTCESFKDLWIDQSRTYTDDVINEEWYLLFRNRFLFCCLAVHTTTSLGDSVVPASFGSFPAGYVAPVSGASGAAATTTAQEVGLKFTNPRQRLIYYQCRLHEVFTFYENIITFMQVIPAAQQSMNPQQLQQFNYTPATSGLYLIKQNIAKDLSQVRKGSGENYSSSSGPTSPTNASSQPVSPSNGGTKIFLSNWLDLVKHLRKSLSDAEIFAAQQASNPQAAKKPKKGVVNPHFAYFFNEHTLHVLSSIFSQLTSEEYHTEVNLLTGVLDEFIATYAKLFDTNSLDTLKSLPIKSRQYIIILVSRFLAYRSSDYDLGRQNVNHMSRFEVMRRKLFFFTLITTLMPTPSEQTLMQTKSTDPVIVESLKVLETSVLHGLQQFLSLDQMNDLQLEGQILYFIERLIVFQQKNPSLSPLAQHLHVGISNVLNMFLKINPKYVTEFLRMSFNEHSPHLDGAQQDAQVQQQQVAQANAKPGAPGAKKTRRNSLILSTDERHFIHREAHPSFRPISLVVARYYLRACATNWTQDLELWNTAYRFGVPQMLCVSLLAQTSSDPESRAIGLLLAAELEKWHQQRNSSSPNLDLAQQSIRLYSHESPFMFIESALRYSTALATQQSYQSYILPILSQAVVLFEYISASKKECLLRILLPWVLELTPLLLASESESPEKLKDQIGVVFLHLTDLTRQSYKASVLNDALKRMWITLLSNEILNERLVKSMVTQVVGEYQILLELSDRAKQAKIEQAMVSTNGQPPKTPLTKKPSVVRQGSASGIGTPSSTNRTLPPNSPPGKTTTTIAEDGSEVITTIPVTTLGAVVGTLAPVSLAVDSDGVIAAQNPCPSPVQDQGPGSSGSGVEGAELTSPQLLDSPSSDDAASPPAFKPLSIQTSLDAGGAARASVTIQLAMSPTAGGSGLAAVPRKHFSERHPQKELALRKFILMQLMRSPASLEILSYLIAALRTYQSDCPSDPESFLKFTAGWYKPDPSGAGMKPEAIHEPVTLNERVAFELLSNIVFENHFVDEDFDPLRDYYPLLLHNSYVLFHSTGEGREMLEHLALALGLYDYNSLSHDSRTKGTTTSRDSLIGSDVLIPLINRTYPRIRHEWSRLALQWACNSRDAAIGEVAWTLFMQLEGNSFFFGESKQEVLVRAVLMLFHSLRRGEEANLKSIVSTLTASTAYPYDRQGWTALVSSGWALLVNSAIPVFSLGLSLLTSMFQLSDIPTDEQRRWILSLGRFLCKSSDQEVDIAICEVLFKGLTSPKTFQPTLILLQSMSNIYAGATLPADNQLIVLLMLVNCLQAMTMIRRLEKLTSAAAASAASGAATPAVIDVTLSSASSTPTPVVDADLEKQIIRVCDDLINLALLLHQYATNESNGRIPLTKLSNIFKYLALSLARYLPDVNISDEPAASMIIPSSPTAPASELRVILFKKLSLLVQQTEANESVMSEAGSSKSAELDGVRLPSLSQLASQFFSTFTSFFSSHDTFNFLVTWFERLLLHASTLEQRLPLLLSLGHFLLESTRFLENSQFQQLAEILTQMYFSNATASASAEKQYELKLIEQLSYLLIEKRPNGCTLNRLTDIFNYVRSKNAPGAAPAFSLKRTASLNAGSPVASSANVLTDMKTYDPASELSEALARMEAHTFPILKQMLTNPRTLTRPMDAAGAKIVRQMHTRTVSHAHISASAMMSPSAPGLSTPSKPLPGYQRRAAFASLFSGPQGVRLSPEQIESEAGVTLLRAIASSVSELTSPQIVMNTRPPTASAIARQFPPGPPSNPPPATASSSPPVILSPAGSPPKPRSPPPAPQSYNQGVLSTPKQGGGPPPLLSKFKVESPIYQQQQSEAPHPASNPFAVMHAAANPQGVVVEEKSDSPAGDDASTAAPAVASSSADVPTPSESRVVSKKRADSDDEDDAALFKAATRRLSNSQSTPAHANARVSETAASHQSRRSSLNGNDRQSDDEGDA